MSQRINITIPDHLYKRLQEVKDSINVSRVCQEAITSAIKVEELKRKGAKDMDTTIERLQAERQLHNKEYEIEGYKDALAHGHELSYETIVKIVRDRDGNSIFADIAMYASFHEKTDPAFDWRAYTTGFTRGVDELWNRLQEKEGGKTIELGQPVDFHIIKLDKPQPNPVKSMGVTNELTDSYLKKLLKARFKRRDEPDREADPSMVEVKRKQLEEEKRLKRFIQMVEDLKDEAEE